MFEKGGKKVAMKKSKLAVGLMAGFLCIGGLAACNEVTYSKDGYILTYTLSDGTVEHYTADDLFKSYYSEADKTQTEFDSIYKLIVKNYFKSEDQAEEYKSIKELASRDVDGDKQTAQKNADTNGTSYDTEFDAILSSHGCKDENELLEYYIYERELDKFEDSFYDDHIDVLRDGGLLGDENYDGYIKTRAPYHVSHILVKVDDGGSSNYWNATISEQDCLDLNKVATYLAEGNNSFGYIANLFSDDEGSKAAFGDLGIMDKSTGYVDEFKLGLYAYENLYGKDSAIASDPEQSSIALDDDQKAAYQLYDGSNAGKIGKIPYTVFQGLEDLSKVTKGYNNSSVHNDAALYYPRNVVFNEYLNKHAVSLIAAEDIDGTAIDTTSLLGFHTVFSGDTTKYLCAKYTYTSASGEYTYDYKPILVVRAGTSDYQGIHFIVANRTPFEVAEDGNGVDISNYYTTYFPGQKEYPTREVGTGDNKKTVDLQTYVNFNNLEDADAKSRAEALKSSITSYDSNLKKVIYRVYKKAGSVKILDSELDKTIEKWIDVTLEKQEFDDEKSWDKTWRNYISNLHQQKNEREKRLPLVTATAFEKYNDPVEGIKPISAEEAAELQARYGDPKVKPNSKPLATTWAEWTYNDLFATLGGPCNDGQKH